MESIEQEIKQDSIIFDQFKVLRCLSKGDSGGVYLCSDLNRGERLTALKITSTSTAPELNRGDALFKEVELSHRVSHPNVLKSGLLYQSDSYSGFTMEYLPGGTLAEKLEAGPMDVEDVVDIISQLAFGLRAVHQAGIIHRDLKPENILCGDDGIIKISDFGIASNGPAYDCSESSSIVGTLNYLCPEYVERSDYDCRSDIYALGVIAYEMVTGKLPFTSSSLVEALTMRVRFDPEPAHTLRPECPAAFSEVIQKAMERDPNKRYKSVDDLLADLRQFIIYDDDDSCPFYGLTQPGMYTKMT